MSPISTIAKHKAITTLLLIAIAGGGYWYYTKTTAQQGTVRYVTQPVERGTLTSSVSGTGQVVSSNQIDVKPQASGKITRLFVKNNDIVSAGQILAQLDSADAQKAVRDAQVNLQSATLSLQKLNKPTDAVSLLQAQNSLDSAKDTLNRLERSQPLTYQKTVETKQKAQDALTKAYADSFNSVSDTFLDLPAIIAKLQTVLYSSEISQGEVSAGQAWNIGVLINTTDLNHKDAMTLSISAAESSYKVARLNYDKTFNRYQSTSRSSDNATIESLLAETLETTKSISQTAKNVSNMLDSWADYRTQNSATVYTKVKDYQALLSTYTSQTNSHISSMLSNQQTIKDNNTALVNAQRDLETLDQNNPLDLDSAKQSVKEKEASLLKLKTGVDPLDVQSQQLTIRQRENSLTDARQKLADYSVRAPIAGVITKLDIKVDDVVSSGTLLSTIIAKQQMTQISVNEVDVTKIKVGQKTTLSFDAIEGLSLTGRVADIDAGGTTTQGVVSYNVKIVFDTQDDRIKSGMSVSATIITQLKQDVLVVPNTAVKSQTGQGSYAEILENGAPVRRAVQVGISNDTSTEIISGLQEGQAVITQTISSTAASTTSPTQNRGILPGLGGGGGGFRAGGGGALR